MGLSGRRFGSIMAVANGEVGQAELWAGDVQLHRLHSPDEARQLRRFWLIGGAGAGCSEAIVTALDWIAGMLEAPDSGAGKGGGAG